MGLSSPKEWSRKETLEFIRATGRSSWSTRRRTRSALRRMGVSEANLTDEERRCLDEDGFVVLENVAAPEVVEQMRESIFGVIERVRQSGPTEGERAQCYFVDDETLIKDLLNKGPIFLLAISHPRVLAAVDHVLKSDLKLSYMHMRMPVVGRGHQNLHIDTYEDDLVHPIHYFANSIWLLCDFNRSNGATRFVPGSHRWGTLPRETIDDLRADHPDQVVVEAKAGSVIVFDGHIWHGGTDNADGSDRPAVFASWVSRNRHQIDDQPALLTPQIQSLLSKEQLYLIGVE